jgi:hypothetical protein
MNSLALNCGASEESASVKNIYASPWEERQGIIN